MRRVLISVIFLSCGGCPGVIAAEGGSPPPIAPLAEPPVSAPDLVATTSHAAPPDATTRLLKDVSTFLPASWQKPLQTYLHPTAELWVRARDTHSRVVVRHLSVPRQPTNTDAFFRRPFVVLTTDISDFLLRAHETYRQRISQPLTRKPGTDPEIQPESQPETQIATAPPVEKSLPADTPTSIATETPATSLPLILADPTPRAAPLPPADEKTPEPLVTPPVVLAPEVAQKPKDPDALLTQRKMPDQPPAKPIPGFAPAPLAPDEIKRAEEAAEDAILTARSKLAAEPPTPESPPATPKAPPVEDKSVEDKSGEETPAPQSLQTTPPPASQSSVVPKTKTGRDLPVKARTQKSAPPVTTSQRRKTEAKVVRTTTRRRERTADIRPRVKTLSAVKTRKKKPQQTADAKLARHQRGKGQKQRRISLKVVKRVVSKKPVVSGKRAVSAKPATLSKGQRHAKLRVRPPSSQRLTRTTRKSTNSAKSPKRQAVKRLAKTARGKQVASQPQKSVKQGVKTASLQRPSASPRLAAAPPPPPQCWLRRSKTARARPIYDAKQCAAAKRWDVSSLIGGYAVFTIPVISLSVRGLTASTLHDLNGRPISFGAPQPA